MFHKIQIGSKNNFFKLFFISNSRLLKIKRIKSKHGSEEQHMCIDYNWTARFDERSRRSV